MQRQKLDVRGLGLGLERGCIKGKTARDEIPGMKLKVSCVFIITDKAKVVGEEVQGVGVMKDEEIKLQEINFILET